MIAFPIIQLDISEPSTCAESIILINIFYMNEIILCETHIIICTPADIQNYTQNVPYFSREKQQCQVVLEEYSLFLFFDSPLEA